MSNEQSNQVHQVIGQSFSHPDYAEWTVATYGSKDNADKHAAFLNAFYQRANDPANNPDRANMLLDVLRDKHPFDPGFVDNGNVEYVVRSLDVLPGPPSAVGNIDAEFQKYKADFEARTAQ